jgi:hypothetical protein
VSASALLAWLVAALDGAGVPYMIVGSFASSAHGIPRTTQDLDVVIDPDEPGLERFLAQIDDERFYVDRAVAHEALRRRSMFNVIDPMTGWKIDLVIRKQRPWSAEELRRRQRTMLLGVPVAIASAEDVILAKLEWARQGGSTRQLEDIMGILSVRGDSLDRAYLEEWIPRLGLDEVWRRVSGQDGPSTE